MPLCINIAIALTTGRSNDFLEGHLPYLLRLVTFYFFVYSSSHET